MLAPIANGRRDKGSSFKKLSKYLTKERDPETGAERGRGEVLLSENLLSLDTAHLEMRGIAAHNPLCNDPIYHYQITWHPGEQPSQEQWVVAARRTLTDLGYVDHQYIVVAHHDKAHFHVHVMVNKVHPDTYRAHTPYRDMFTLDKAMRELEHEQGWQEDVGHFRWDKEQGASVKNTREEMRALSKHGAVPKGKAAEMEHYRDAQSLQTYAKGKPAADLQMILARHNVSWSDVHAMLYRHGLEIKRAEHGGYTVHTVDSGIYVKASDVFRRAFSGKLNRQATEAKLGAWQEPSPKDRNNATPVQKYEKRPPATTAERQKRREQREGARLALKRRFGEYRSTCRGSQKNCTERARKRRAELMAALKVKKHEIRARAIPWSVKRTELSRAVAENVVQCHLLKAEAMQERFASAAMRYEDWVMREAKRGNEVAAAQLRGWRYQDRRIARQTERSLASMQNVVHLSAGSPDDNGDWSEPIPGERLRELKRCQELAQQFARIRWTIDRRSGNIRYSIDGKVAVEDRGKALSIFTTEETAVILGVEIAARRYGRCISATGSEEWKQKVAQIAARADVAVEFTDPRMRAVYLEEQLRLGKAGALERHFSGLAVSLRTMPDKPIAFSGRADTVIFLESLWPNGGGKLHLADLERGLEAGKVRKSNLKSICELTVSKAPDGQFMYSLRCLPGKSSDLASLLSKASIRVEREGRAISTVHHIRSRAREHGQYRE